MITRLNIGGPSIQAVALSHRLEAFGYRTRLVHGKLGAAEGDMAYLMNGTGIEAQYEPSLQRPLTPVSDVQALHRLYRTMCRVRPAIVHTHMAKAGALARAAAWLYNRTAGRARPARIIHTYHGHVLEGYFGRGRTAVFLATERLLARTTDRLVAISPRVREELATELAIGRPEQYVVVPLGFDLDAFLRVDAGARAAGRAALGVPEDALVVSTVGRLTAIKQHDLFLQMAALVLRRCPNALFLIVGDGELRAGLERRAADLGVGHRVRFLGWRRDLAAIYAATDVFALTSKNEGTPVALIEAMASAVPGVSTDVGGVRDVIASADLGARVPDGDAAALADAVAGLLASDERRAMGARARESVRTRFSIDRLVGDIAALYGGLLAGPAGAGPRTPWPRHG